MQQIKTFSDVQNLIGNKKDIMVSTNPFFETLRDPNLSEDQKSLFIPFMLFFSMACPDVMTSQMMIKKYTNDISDVERRVNAFVSEDNFHYILLRTFCIARSVPGQIIFFSFDCKAQEPLLY